MSKDLLLSIEKRLNSMGTKTNIEKDISNYHKSVSLLKARWAIIHLIAIFFFYVAYYYLFAEQQLDHIKYWNSLNDYGKHLIIEKLGLLIMPLFIFNFICFARVFYAINDFKNEKWIWIASFLFGFVFTQNLFIISFSLFIISIGSAYFERTIDMKKFCRYKFTKNMTAKLNAKHDETLEKNDQELNEIKVNKKENVFEL